ncbi:uncharacterized protein LOC105843499 [Hydra vulgaris]|uniref:Uncharacterized protein LOC105843499 n=1 Tax=Hydra vulgaris TaxID=6087 RepID=A0ABM4C4N3_HYDVU
MFSNKTQTLTNNTNNKNIVNDTTYVLVTLCPIGIVLHITGIYLLLKSKKLKMHKIDRVIIFNLSLTEILTNVILFFLGILNIVGKPHKTWMIVSMRTFIFAYYITTVLLTINRFLILYLNVKYYSFVSKKKVIYCLITFWVCSFLVGFWTAKIKQKEHAILDITFDGFIAVLSIFVYSYALILSRNMSNNISLIQNRKAFLKSLILPATIVSTYLALTAIPHFISAYYILKKAKANQNLALALDIVLVLAYWKDAVIYLYTNKFRKYFGLICRKKLSKKFNFQEIQETVDLEKHFFIRSQEEKKNFSSNSNNFFVD